MGIPNDDIVGIEMRREIGEREELVNCRLSRGRDGLFTHGVRYESAGKED